MKIFENFLKDKVQTCDYQIRIDNNKKDNFVFEKELLKSKNKNNLIENNKNDFIKNKKSKKHNNKLTKNENISVNQNINEFFDIDKMKNYSKDNNKDKICSFEEYKNNKDNEVKEDVEENILYNISLTINVPMEEIKDIMKELNINIEELNKNNNLVLFLEKVFDVDNTTELLTIKEVNEIIKNIDKILENVKDNNFFNLLDTNINEEDNKKLSEVDIKEIGSLDNKETINTKFTYIEKDKYENEEKINKKEILFIENENKIEDHTNEKNNNLFNEDNLYNDFENKEEKSKIIINQNKEIKSFLENEESFQKELNVSNFNINTEEIKDIVEEKTNVIFNKEIKTVKNHEIINQITNKLSNSFKLEVSELKIKLKPEHLGEVTVKVSTENGIVTAKFIAENEKIKEIIESRFNDLKYILNKQGVNISELSVSVEDENKNNYMKEFFKEREKSKTRVKKIINNIIEENNENINYVKPRDIYDNKVDYTA